MSLPCHRLPLMALATLVVSLTFSAQAEEPQPPAAPLAASAPAMPASSAASAAATPGDSASGLMTYERLMKLTVEARMELLSRLPPAQFDKFLATLSGDRKAVLAVDPEDCGGRAKLRRFAIATGKPDEGFASKTAQNVGSSVSLGAMNLLAPGLGRLVSNAAQLNEVNKLRQEHAAYKDVCDLSPEDRAALLSSPPQADAAPRPDAPTPPKKEESFLDRASRFFAR